MMNSQALFCLTFFTFLFAINRLSPIHAFYLPSKITINNGCPYPIWPAIHTKLGKHVQPTGFALPSHKEVTLHVDTPWSGKIWGRTHCSWNNNHKFHCKVGDCGTGDEKCHGMPKQPVTVVDLVTAPTNGTSYFAIDLTNGANVPVNIVPMDFDHCSEIQCYTDLKLYCPDWLTVYDDTGKRIACKSACLATGEPKFCCSGKFASRQGCALNPYDQFIKSTCPNAMSNPYLNEDKKFSCHGGIGFGVYFCG